ncbi:inner membrane peptidase [Idiomarina fontislapidosi]|uniref:Protease SohB n=1 Tax=Idiomarina fontislapidosi TaxID=263723 RepID=A0A432YB09_9GAMM|nr:protease SohB [Idiomarina fontislapidosi]PYE35249.1 inner membrane peptidase [Idiomarina fontislapidosi]RUO58144.1 protease SohB [Idiomarina fontislapidosi]
MEFLADIGGFIIKAGVIVLALVIVLGVVAQTAQKQKRGKGALDVSDVSKELNEMRDHLRIELLDGKAQKKAQKALKKARKGEHNPESKLFVIDFKGSVDAKEVDSLRREVNAIVSIATDQDEVLVRLESGGGVVHGYGLGAAQLQRLTDHGLKVTIAVDKVAASGGYMMACVGQKILSAPFAFIGSIGVVAQLPNVNKWLKNHDIDIEQITAGEYKRTLTVLGENTEEGRRKFKQDLESIHAQFKAHVQRHRPALDIEKVATGEVWTGTEALELGLVDEVVTSDAWLLKQLDTHRILKVEYSIKKPFSERFAKGTATLVNTLKSTFTRSDV